MGRIRDCRHAVPWLPGESGIEDQGGLRMGTQPRQGSGEALDNRASVLRVVRLACLVAGLTLLGSTAGAGDTHDGSQPTARASPGYLHVEIVDESVTVKARDGDVKGLLEEIARQSDLVIDLHGPLDERVTIEFDRLPVPEALDRILRGRDFVLRYFDPSSDPATPANAYPSKLWVFSKGLGDHNAPPENGDAAFTREGVGGARAQEADASLVRLSLALADDDVKVRLEAVSELASIESDQAAAALATALSDGDPSVREEAACGLGEIGDETDLEILEQALMDPDLRVREAAVEAVTDIGGDDSAWALAFALTDVAPSLREDAVYALSEIGSETAIGILQQVLTDEQRSVREAAAEVLAELSSREH